MKNRHFELDDGASGPGDKGDIFEDIWPSPTRGDGRIRPNNLRSGAGQGKGGTRKKVSCRQCGMLADLNRDDSQGGSLGGNGGIASVTTGSQSVTISDGKASMTEYYGDSVQKKGGGCPLCGSQNYAEPTEKPSTINIVPRTGI